MFADPPVKVFLAATIAKQSSYKNSSAFKPESENRRVRQVLTRTDLAERTMNATATIKSNGTICPFLHCKRRYLLADTKIIVVTK